MKTRYEIVFYDEKSGEVKTQKVLATTPCAACEKIEKQGGEVIEVVSEYD
jgi:hypothetical protein